MQHGGDEQYSQSLNRSQLIAPVKQGNMSVMGRNLNGQWSMVCASDVFKCSIDKVGLQCLSLPAIGEQLWWSPGQCASHVLMA